MPELVAPAAHLYAEWLAAHEEWGPGTHEDGFGLGRADDVGSPSGFGAWVARLRDQADPAKASAMHRMPCRYWWILEDRRVVGGIALRHGDDARLERIGHIGYGVRPSARGRGLATWALAQVLEQARALGMERVLLVCEEHNTASARTIERLGGVLEGVQDTEHGPVRRYRVGL